MHGLAGVGRRKTRKQMLNDMVVTACVNIDKSKGLHGRGDWHGAAESLLQAASLVEQAVDLAETLPGVNFERTREQTGLVKSRLESAKKTLDSNPIDMRQRVLFCAQALSKAVEAVSMFISRLRDDFCEKSQAIDFCEKELISDINKAGGDHTGPKPKVGSGKRFEQLTEDIKGEGDVEDPEAVAAAIGRKKYGKEKFQQMAGKGKKG